MKTLKACNLLRTAAIAGAMITNANAINILNNGGFESGFDNWSRAEQVGSEGTFFLQTGTTSPVVGETVPAPPEGTTAAMTDAEGPGARVLYQSFSLAAPAGLATLDFELFIGNRADDFYAPATLDFATPELNQQARVDILLASADPFSVDPSDVLFSAFQTMPGNDLVSGYTSYSLDITTLLNANLNTDLILRFAQTDNVFLFQFGVDNVAIDVGEAPVPDGGPGLLAALAFAGICCAGTFRNQGRFAGKASA